MSRWSDKYENLQIHQTLKQLMDCLDIEVEEIDADQEVERRRLEKALNTIAQIIDGIDREFFPEAFIDQLDSSLRHPTVWQNITSYSSAPNAQKLRQANDHVTGAVSPLVYQLAALSREPESREVVTKVEEAYDAFCKLIGEREHKFAADLSARLERLNKMDQHISALDEAQKKLEKETTTTLSAWQAEFTEAQTKRAQEYSDRQIERGSNFDEALREWRSQAEEEMDEISSKYKELLESSFKNYSGKVEDLIDDMTKKHEAVLEIHGLVGTDGVAGGYQRGANDEKSAANRWRMISMGALVLAAIWIGVRYFLGFDLTPSGGINWDEVVTAASLTLVLLGAAGYAARQSKLHRETEQHMRWFALEVKAIDPFLSSLPKEEQDVLKTQLSQKLFGQNRVTTDQSDGSVDTAAFNSIMGSFLSLAKVLGKH